MKKIAKSLFILLLIAFSNFTQTIPVHAQNSEWRITVFLSNQYVSNQLNTNVPFELSNVGKEWFILIGHSFNVNLDKLVLKVKLHDLSYVDTDQKGMSGPLLSGPLLGVNKSVNLEVKLLSWHTVYVTEFAKDGKSYETLYGLVSSDNGQTYQYKVIIPRREQK